MKPNADKCHLIVCNLNKCYVTLENNLIENERTVELLDITIENSLKYSDHVSKLCTRANQKLHALARISNFMSQDKLRTLMKSFVTSQTLTKDLLKLNHSLSSSRNMNYDEFKNIFIKVLNRHAPIKEKRLGVIMLHS